VPGWDEASGWSNTHVFLTPDETLRIQAEVLRLLRRYEDRLTNPALRPEGALPVEWTVFASPLPELAESAESGPGPDDPGGARPGGPGCDHRQ
jgi:hypothetical protein